MISGRTGSRQQFITTSYIAVREGSIPSLADFFLSLSRCNDTCLVCRMGSIPKRYYTVSVDVLHDSVVLSSENIRAPSFRALPFDRSHELGSSSLHGGPTH
jgi:hypothetical protein